MVQDGCFISNHHICIHIRSKERRGRKSTRPSLQIHILEVASTSSIISLPTCTESESWKVHSYFQVAILLANIRGSHASMNRWTTYRRSNWRVTFEKRTEEIKHNLISGRPSPQGRNKLTVSSYFFPQYHKIRMIVPIKRKKQAFRNVK